MAATLPSRTAARSSWAPQGRAHPGTVAIPRNSNRLTRKAQACVLTGSALALILTASSALGDVAFGPVYDALTQHCGECHVSGEADGPWSLNTPPGPNRFPQCLEAADGDQARCATFHELVDAPAPGIPPWVVAGAPLDSAPFQQACLTSQSFHLGHSLAEQPDAALCDLLKRWIEAGSRY